MILLIGYGNTLRSDDGAGWAVVERVAAAHDGREIRIETSHQLMPEMVTELAADDIEGVVFVDAADAAAGDCPFPQSVAVTPSEATPDTGHYLTPERLLCLANALNGGHPPAWRVSVPGRDFRHGEGLSAFARRNVRIAARMVRDLIENVTRRPEADRVRVAQ